MLDDIQDEILESIQKELDKIENKQKIRDTVFRLSHYCFKPFQYFAYIMTLVVLLILIFSSISLFLLGRIYCCRNKI